MKKFVVDLICAIIGAAILGAPLIIYFWGMKP